MTAAAAGPAAPSTLPVADLSDAQARLWTLETQLGAGAVHVFAIAHELDGPVDDDLLAAALAHVAQLHTALRVRVATDSGKAAFYLTDAPALLRRSIAADSNQLAATLKRVASTPIDVTQGAGWRSTLLTLSLTRRVLVLQFHHLIADRASVGVFGADLTTCYGALVNGQSLPTVPGQRTSLAATAPSVAEAEPLAAYWRALFATPPVALMLPGAFATQNFQSYEGERLEALLGATTTVACKAQAQAQQASLFTVLLAAFAATLHCHTGQEDLVVCTPMAGRHRGGTRRAMGYFNNIVPLRVDLAGDPTCAELIARITRQLRGAMANQDLPFHAIAGLSALAGTRLTHCLFSLQNTPGLQLALPDIRSRHFDIGNGTANFDVAVFIEEMAGDLVLLLDRKTGVVGPHAAQRLQQRFFATLALLCADANQRLSALPRYADVVDDEVPVLAVHQLPIGVKRDALRDAELERRIIDLWREVFRSERDAAFPEIDRDSHFFRMGGDSIRAARLFMRMEEMFGHHLPLAMLIEAPTPRLIAERLADEQWVAPFLTLLPVKPVGSRPPLFCLHGGGGNVLQFGFIAEQLHAEQPLYCLQPYDLERGALSSVEEMAKHYLRVVQQFRPHGPYLFAGASLGGAVAYEMAQRLMASGEEVSFVGLIDYMGPGITMGLRDRLDEHGVYLRTLPWIGRFSYVARLLLRRIGIHASDNSRAALHPTEQANAELLEAAVDALKRYVLRPYRGRVVLFRAQEGARYLSADRKGGWGALVDRIEVFDVPGDHISITHPPQVFGLARAFAQALAGGDAT